jgi:putative PIG3 family NAD(P)H quinone oxidoreductase
MRAVGADLSWSDVPTPEPGPGQIRIRVRATAVNRADLMQQKGLYPPPPGASPILGLEAAGEVDAVGPGAGWALGDRVCALLSGGGYAEQVVCPAGHALPIPDRLDFLQAAALPEVFATARLNVWTEAAAQPGERVVVHAGASGVGTAAIQLCRALGNPCFVTVGSDEKLARCIELGADAGANRKAGRWADAARAWAPQGIDVVLDPVGGGYLEDDVALLATGGRVVVIGLMGGRTATLDLGRLLVKRLRVIGSVLRSRTEAEKDRVVADLRRVVWPLVERGEVRPIVDRVLPVTRVAEALDLVASDRTFGKVVLSL